jgi:guanylate kinase
MSAACNDYNLYHPQPLLIVISGPSGVGKDALLQELHKRDLPLHFVVTATSRPPREGEVNGVDYWFVSVEEFERMIREDELLEHAVVYNQYKGIPKEQIRKAMESGKDVVLRIDVQGAATIRKLCPEALMIFLSTTSEEELKTRLINRKTDTVENLNLRIQTACQELKRVNEFDYVVINKQDCLDKTADDIIDIISAEHHRVNHRKVTL